MHKKTKKREKNMYLRLYNVGSMLGWTWVLYCLCIQSSQLIYYTSLVQSFAVLEILHAFTIVKTNPITTMIQVGSRLYLVAIINMYQTHGALYSMILAWSVTEIVRYGYYFLQLLHQDWYWITYLRYTMFFVLYPLGAGSEALLAWHARREMSFWGSLGTTLICVLYVPGLYVMYTHMIRQRRKAL
jgi:very-long-chain (3R)-3-hydroxyacyl-CoA dehydratase